ncbi:hypothetical protein ACGF12_33190 [Kitasatospora sp. NPDC048296]|uniref:hypothetical protein n=1 Tax=Kitasatospora sp. NPDC048296 TaxID=3364048 RepID=UPI003712B56E
MALEHPPPSCPVAVSDGWEKLADGLAVQRIHLHRRELENALGKGVAECGLPAQASPLALISRPLPPPDAAVADVSAAGLLPFVTVPQQIGRGTDGGPLVAPARAVAQMLTAGGLEDAAAQGIEAVCAASAWWVGAFAVLRHRGGHHVHIDDDVTDTVALTTLVDATHAVALGAATRVLRRRLQLTGDGNPQMRDGYCRAVTEAIVTEPTLPALLESLGELRLVDLVANALPWRGQYLKYRSGLGAGQVE